MTYGATPLREKGVQFRVWAPNLTRLGVKIEGIAASVFPMTRAGEDFEVLVPDAHPGDLYKFVLNGELERPDPVSRSQPQGVHGPSEIVDPRAFVWSDHSWRGIPLRDSIFYELHTGTFTPEGTFEGVISRIRSLKELGITAIELMPVAEFPGSRNWGYDGVNLYAPHSVYGGPCGLKKLVNVCHREGLAVVLDVVYNHLGPEGNYLGDFGPFFTDRYKTPWGAAINFDGTGSDGVRRFFIENALYWLTEYHIDALRLDAIHGIFDFGAVHILAELGERFHAQAERLGRQAWIIAESDLNDVRVIRPRSAGGYGLDAQWHDEFHHAVVSYMTGADRGYLSGFGRLKDIQKAITAGFVYDGCYSAYRGRHFGSSAVDEPGEKFVAFLQNHDQVANTAQGRRLSELVSIEQYKLAVALLLCSPYLPLLFMGEEFAETSPFLYFTSHTDPALARAVTEGRRAEFQEFTLPGEFPDPQSPETFRKSRITWALVGEPRHAAILRLYRDLIALRKQRACLGNCRKDLVRVTIDDEAEWLMLHRGDPDGSEAMLVCNFGKSNKTLALDTGPSDWKMALWTGAPLYGGDADRFSPPALLPKCGESIDVTVPGPSAALYISADKLARR
ncbi:MAG TPA: malto-oligosyltrehalose trehalohydrolase [Bryobacteraceae bacterium]|nr:malto-oligosyltrehalose trehalohydrolase [Bryobacteraceae bacterium]